MPITIKEFIDELIASFLLDADQCALCLDMFGIDGETGDAELFAARLVANQELTQFQASAALQRRATALVIGDYHILDVIGAGGMGQVYKARHRIMKRLLAIKIMHTARATNPTLVQRFYREVEAAARLSHPNIVTAYDAGETPGGLYLAMEYVDGVDLSVILRNVGALSVNQAINITLQVARGLAYAHRHRVVHRDIKPGNLLLDRDGTVKILDMGLARFTEEEAAEVSLTMVGPLMGTVEYMAPEHAANPKNADHRSDVYSLGCTMYRLLTGRLPYGGETAVEKVIAQREHPIPSLSDAIGGIPENLQGIFERMVAKAPRDRYQSMDECLADLVEIAGEAEQCDISGLTDIVPSSTATTVCDGTPLEAETTVRDDVAPPPTLDASQTTRVDERHEAPAEIDASAMPEGSPAGDDLETDEYSSVYDSPEPVDELTADESSEDQENSAGFGESAVHESPPDEITRRGGDEPEHEDYSTREPFQWLRILLAGFAVLVGVAVGIGLKTYFSSGSSATPMLGGQWINLLEHVDADKDSLAGKWEKMGDRSVMAFAGAAEHSRMTTGKTIKPNYQVRMSFTRLEGDCGVALILPLGSGDQAALEIDGADGEKSSLGDSGYGVRVEADGSVLGSGVRHTCLVSVEDSGDWTTIRISLDGRKLIEYEGPASELHLGEDWDCPAGRLGFGVHSDVSAQIHELSVRALPQVDARPGPATRP